MLQLRMCKLSWIYIYIYIILKYKANYKQGSPSFLFLLFISCPLISVTFDDKAGMEAVNHALELMLNNEYNKAEAILKPW